MVGLVNQKTDLPPRHDDGPIFQRQFHRTGLLLLSERRLREQVHQAMDYSVESQSSPR